MADQLCVFVGGVLVGGMCIHMYSYMHMSTRARMHDKYGFLKSCYCFDSGHKYLKDGTVEFEELVIRHPLCLRLFVKNNVVAKKLCVMGSVYNWTLLNETKGVQDLELYGAELRVHGKSLFTELKKFVGLKKLGFAEMNITDDDMSALSELEQLESLYINNCEQVSDVGVAHLIKLRNMKSLELMRCKFVTGKGLNQFVNLTNLSLAECSITDYSLKDEVSKMINLESLCLCAEVTDEGIKSLEDLKSLRSLGLNNCHKVTDLGISGLIGLTKLMLRGATKVSGIGLDGMVNLRVFDSRYSRFKTICADGSFVTSHLPQIQELSLPNADKGCVAELVNMRNLHKLSLGSGILSDNDFDSICGIEGLQSLNITLICDIFNNIAKIESLQKATNLVELHISGKWLCNEQINDVFGKMKNLKILKIYDCKEVNNKGIAMMRKWKNLQYLKISVERNVVVNEINSLREMGVMVEVL